MTSAPSISLRLAALAALSVACGSHDHASPAAKGAATAAPAAPVPVSELAPSRTAEPLAPSAPTVVVTTDGILVAGQRVLALDHGALVGGEGALARPELALALAALAKTKADDDTPLVILARAETPYGTLVTVAASARTSFHHQAIGVRAADGSAGALPLTLPEMPKAMAAGRGGTLIVRSVDGKLPAPDPDQPLQLVVTLEPAKLTLFSLSGLEGTASEPRGTWPVAPTAALDVAGLNQTLVEIAGMRWQGKLRPLESYDLVLMAGRATPLARVVAVFDAARQDLGAGASAHATWPATTTHAGTSAPNEAYDPHRHVLFPHVLLSME